MKDTMQEDQLLGAKSDINMHSPPIEEETHTDNVCLEVFIQESRLQSFQVTPRFCCANQDGKKTKLKNRKLGS